MLGRISAPLALAACLLAGGCGGGTKTVIVSTPPTETAATTTRSSPASPANAGIVHRGAFRSPSGNIGCAIAGAAARCEVQVAYAIGVARPVSVFVETFGTERVDRTAIAKAVDEIFDLRPAAIIRDLDLRRPIYQNTAAYGHFGRSDQGFAWEQTSRLDALRSALSLT